jgi:hypothetical protein
MVQAESDAAWDPHDDPVARSRYCAKIIDEITGSDSPRNSGSDERMAIRQEISSESTVAINPLLVHISCTR